jgi:hypothetical protein
MQTLSSAPDPAVSIAVTILVILVLAFGLHLDPRLQSLQILGMIMMINRFKVFQNFPKIQKVNLLP